MGLLVFRYWSHFLQLFSQNWVVLGSFFPPQGSGEPSLRPCTWYACSTIGLHHQPSARLKIKRTSETGWQLSSHPLPVCSSASRHPHSLLTDSEQRAVGGASERQRSLLPSSPHPVRPCPSIPILGLTGCLSVLPPVGLVAQLTWEGMIGAPC